MSERVVDCNGAEITVGATAWFGESTPDNVCEVVRITEMDADYNDELGRGEMIPPRVTVRFRDGTEDGTACYDATQHSWATSYPDGPDVWVFRCDDVEVAPSEQRGAP